MQILLLVIQNLNCYISLLQFVLIILNKILSVLINLSNYNCN